ncbi:MAG TPA: ATP-binding protein [Gallionella sp.]|nr:ATP-binding protein [Gallionella sp.]
MLQKTVENLPVRVFWKDRESRFLGGNAMFAKDAGLPSSRELIGKTDFDLIWKEHAQRYRDDDRQVMESGVARLEFEEPSIFGEKTSWVRTSKIPMRDASGNVVGILGVYEDITAQKQAADEIRKVNVELEAKVQERTAQLLTAQDELVHREKLALLGKVADTVGHELRNPLGVMNNAVYFLQTVLSDADETTKEYLGIIKEEIADAERIVSDLLDAVRTKPPHLAMVGVKELIEKALRKFEMPSTVTLRLDIQTELPEVRVDSTQMLQVFWNLITNALEAMPEGGELEIKAEKDASQRTVTVSIKDSGCGIAPEHQGRLFQLLFTTKVRHIGLGLTVVRNLTGANGGSVRVQSQPGKGSTFSVTLPCNGQASGTL